MQQDRLDLEQRGSEEGRGGARTTTRRAARAAVDRDRHRDDGQFWA